MRNRRSRGAVLLRRPRRRCRAARRSPGRRWRGRTRSARPRRPTRTSARIASGSVTYTPVFFASRFVRVEHLRGAAAERAVHEPLHPADADEVVAEVRLRPRARPVPCAARSASAGRCGTSACPSRASRWRTRNSLRRVSGALPSMSCTLVTPSSAACFCAASTASRISSSSGSGMSRSTSDIALSLQDAGRRLAVGEPVDDAAGRVLRVGRHAGELERRGVRQGHVPVVPADEDGPVLHVLVDGRGGRQLAAERAVVVPVAAERSSGRAASSCRTPRAACRTRPRPSRPSVRPATSCCPPPRKCSVAVVEPRHDAPAAEVDHLRVRPGEWLHLGVGADLEDAAAPHRDGLRLGLRRRRRSTPCR